MKKITYAFLGIIILSFAIGAFLYPIMPAKMASHWNTAGEVNGYLSKFWGLFLMPIISVAMLGLFLALPKIDPLKKNIVKFRKYFDGFIFIIMLFMLYIYGLTILWNLEYRFAMSVAIAPAIAVLLYFAGILNENAKRNWFIGIRTPWTLSSDKVWNKTHKLGGKLFKICAVLALISMFFPKYAIWLMLAPILISVLVLFVYSYVEFQKK